MLIVQLLKRDPKERLQNLQAIKEHPFFNGVDWIKVAMKPKHPRRMTTNQEILSNEIDYLQPHLQLQLPQQHLTQLPRLPKRQRQ